MNVVLPFRVLMLAAAVSAAAMLMGGATAPAQTIYLENFEDEMLEENTMIANSTIMNGSLFLDDNAANLRATFSVVQDLTQPVLTFSFDIVEPITQADGLRYELLIRAGVGTAHNTLSSSDQIVEAIIFRDGNRGAYMNNGNETIFLIANNQATPITFASPIDASEVMLDGFQYIPYVLDNNTGTYGQIKGISNFNAANSASFGTFARFAIGSSTTGDVGTATIDNVLVTEGATFERDLNLGVPGDVNGDMIADMEDYFIIRDAFQTEVTTREEGDLHRDGIVNLNDFRAWKNAFYPGGAGAGVSLGEAVPEPATGLMLVLAALVLGAGWRRR